MLCTNVFGDRLADSRRAGVPLVGRRVESLNNDGRVYGVRGDGNPGGVHPAPVASHGRLRPLQRRRPSPGVLFLKREETTA